MAKDASDRNRCMRMAYVWLYNAGIDNPDAVTVDGRTRAESLGALLYETERYGCPGFADAEVETGDYSPGELAKLRQKTGFKTGKGCK